MAYGSAIVRSKKPEGPFDNCQKSEDRMQYAAELFFWLLASVFWLLPYTFGPAFSTSRDSAVSNFLKLSTNRAASWR